MFIEPSWFWNALPTRFQKCRPLLSTMLYAAQGLRPLPPFPDCCWFSICPPSAPPPARATCWSRTRASPTLTAEARCRRGMGVRKWQPRRVPVATRKPALSVRHPQRWGERAGHVDLPELRLVLRHVVLQRVQEALHVLGAVDHPRTHDRLRRLRLHVDEVDDEFRLVVVQHRHVDVHALCGLLVDLKLDLHLRRCGGIVSGHARLLALGSMWRKRLRPCGEAATAARCMAGPADPFALGDGPDACLLLHGLTGSPAEMRPVGDALAAAGFRAVAPLLPGHGTTPEDLSKTTRADLELAAQSALLSLAGARRIFLCGLSVGGLLSIGLAARSWTREGLPDFSAIALLAAAIDFKGTTWLFAHVIGRLPALALILGKGARDISGEPDQREKIDASYTAIPMRWGAELRLLSEEAQKLAPRVHAPALLLHGALDRTVAASGSGRLARMLGSSQVEVRVLPRSGHVLPLDVESAEVCRDIVSFFQGVG